MLKKGDKVELIKPCRVELTNGEVLVSKENPLKGTIEGFKPKKVAGKLVTMCCFTPEGEDKEDYIILLGSKWFRKVE